MAVMLLEGTSRECNTQGTAPIERFQERPLHVQGQVAVSGTEAPGGRAPTPGSRLVHELVEHPGGLLHERGGAGVSEHAARGAHGCLAPQHHLA